MSTEDKIWFSAKEIEMLGIASIARLPASERGATQKAQREKWSSRTVQGKGGKGGLKTEYQPPKPILDLIKKFLEENPDFFEKEKGALEEVPQHKLDSTEPSVEPPPTLDDFALVPRYDVRGSAGHGSIIHSEQIVDHLAFRADWVKTALGATEKDLVLISVKGDSMEPTISNEDLILVNMRENRIEDNAIYVLQHDGALLVKRIQRKMDGTVLIKSDNPLYEQEVLDSSQAESLRVLGRVVWFARKI